MFLAVPAFAQDEDGPSPLPRLIFLEKDGPTTDDPNHRGYAYDQDDLPFPIKWKEIAAQCDPCKPLADAYNQTMQSLMNTRYWIAEIEDRQSDIQGRNNFTRSYGGAPQPGENTGLNPEQEKQAAAELSYRMGVEDMAGRLPALKAQEESLQALSDDLYRQLEECEARMCTGGGFKPVLKAGVELPSANLLPFDWKGPYPPVCQKCAKLAERLNELPTLARVALAGLEAARADLMFAEMELLSIQAEHDDIILERKVFDTHPDGKTKTDKEIQEEIRKREKDQQDYEKKTRKRRDEMEAKKKKAEEDIAKYEADLDAITKNFEETLKLYEDCIKTCTGKTETGMMIDPAKPKQEYALGGSPGYDFGKCYGKFDLGQSFTLGANAEYGTGAQMKNKAKDMATGMAMGALGNVTGGGGISLGGGGDGIGSPMGGDRGGSDGPKLDKNPLRGLEYQPFKWEGFYVGVQGGFTDDGFVLNEQIEESPDGNSTFHATWLQDSQGRTIMPSRYYIYDIYRDHKLTVWWTYDHWTNGVHDAHDEGSETSQWREDLGSYKLRFGGEKGIQNSIWYQSGFDTAVKGVRHIGALYDIAPEDLMGECGLASVTHLTLPGQDPVTTVPFIKHLFVERDEGKNLRDLMIHITPAIVDTDSE
ncbi:MAG: hypothetical protein WBK55_08990 [Alphaproteobacteria bacterium]